ncbi:40s ribosomal protein s5-1 [Hordeum vulgare]|nr:40s ribosomal protein s5-1 [Hordeum vulgare]
MATSCSSKDKFFEKVINPYIPKVIKHLQDIEMHEGVLHIRDVQGPKKEATEKARRAAVEQEIFKCQGMFERGLSVNHSMITDFNRQNKLHIKNVGEALFKLQERLKTSKLKSFTPNQNCEYELSFKRMSIAADFRVPKTRCSIVGLGGCTPPLVLRLNRFGFGGKPWSYTKFELQRTSLAL